MGEYIFGNKPVYAEKSGGPAGLGFSRENQVFFLQTRLKGMGSVPRKPAGRFWVPSVSQPLSLGTG